MPIEHSPKKTGNGENESDFLGFDDGDRKTETPVDAVTAARFKSLSRQREQVLNKLLRIYGAVNGQQPVELAQLKVYRTNLQSTYAEFSSFHSQIVAIVPDAELVPQEEKYLHFEKFFNWTSTAVETRIQMQPSINPTPPAQVVVHQQPLKAPIPTFDGDYTKWPKFKAMFQDIMAHSRDSESIKLYHLDKSLVGAAAGVLDAKTINEANYSRAWKILSERYENQRVIVETHIHGLLSLKKMTSESSQELRILLDGCTNHVESLQYLAQEMTGVSELMIVYLLTAALDKSTRRLWEQSLKPGELPKYAPTIAFLKSQCQVLERCEACYPVAVTKPASKQVAQPAKQSTQSSQQPATTQRSLAATTKNDEPPKCDICGAAHRNYQCNVLNSLPHTEKIKKARLAGICFNCFRKDHRSEQCPSPKTCRKCQKRHHTQLHDDSKTIQESVAYSAIETPNPESTGGHATDQSTASTSTKPALRFRTSTLHPPNHHQTSNNVNQPTDAGCTKPATYFKFLNTIIKELLDVLSQQPTPLLDALSQYQPTTAGCTKPATTSDHRTPRLLIK